MLHFAENVADPDFVRPLRSSIYPSSRIPQKQRASEQGKEGGGSFDAEKRARSTPPQSCSGQRLQGVSPTVFHVCGMYLGFVSAEVHRRSPSQPSSMQIELLDAHTVHTGCPTVSVTTLIADISVKSCSIIKSF